MAMHAFIADMDSKKQIVCHACIHACMHVCIGAGTGSDSF